MKAPEGSWPTDEEGRRKAGLCTVECFKDRFCGYKGEESWCDRTRARCHTLGNGENFSSTVPKWPDWGEWWDRGFLIASALLMTATWLWVESRAWAFVGYAISTMVGLPFCRQEATMRVCQLWLSIRHPDRPTLRVQGLPGSKTETETDYE